jgi:transposase-like protein
MKQPKFNSEQIAELLKNKHVAKCSATNITYSRAFKALAVKQYAEGMPAVRIFREAGFDLDIIGNRLTMNCLGRWRKTFKVKGENGLLIEARGSTKGCSNGGRPKTKGLTDADRIKRLEIENAYLKAKYDFLVKLRAQRKS